MATSEAQKRAIKAYDERQKHLGYAKVCRKMPIAFVRQIEAFIKDKTAEWEEMNK